MFFSASGLGPVRMNISEALLYAPQCKNSGWTPSLSSSPRRYGCSANMPVSQRSAVGTRLSRLAPARRAKSPVCSSSA